MATRGHRFKLIVQSTHKQVLSSHFIHRITPIWNSLTNDCFINDRLLYFKHKISNTDFSMFLKGHS